jgi:outer membrane receptor protein involved in Fe transport
LFSITGTAAAQGNGTISGKVVDKSNNEVLIGANVMILGTHTGAISDLDGNFMLRNVPAGTYQIRFSFISYHTVTVEEVKVNPNTDTRLSVALTPSSIQMQEVVVTAQAMKNSEAAVINIQKNSSNIVDGVSAELIGRNSSSDGTDVLKRMTGITIAEGKYAFVRGVGERYNNTLLNGSSLPSTDPEKKSFSYDMFPANLIENLLTSKTATPDKPADFSGGLIEINTVEFPAEWVFNISTSSVYDAKTSFSDFMHYRGGSRDWLAMDDGTRALPSLIDHLKVSRGNYSQTELQSIGLAFANNWGTLKSTAPMKGDLKISLGNSVDLGQNILGYIASFNYSNQDVVAGLERNNYTFEGPRYLYKGTNYSNSVAWSGMLNTSIKLGNNHKFSLKNIYNQNADDETTLYEGPYYYYPDYRKVTSLRYVSRSLFSSQIIGEHHFKLLHGIGFDWNLNYGQSRRDEPDARRYVYSRDLYEPDDPLRFLLDQSVSTRFYGDLDDKNSGASANISLKPFASPNLPSFKFGYHFDFKKRDFSARTFGYKNLPGGNYIAEDQLMTETVDKIFTPANFNQSFIEVSEITKPSDSYASDQSIHAGYIMTDFQVTNRTKIVTGVRYERSEQDLDSYSITNEPLQVRHSYNDWLPSLNVTFAPREKMNLRAAFARTLARPEFRELAPFSYFDFVANELVQGNINLQRSLVTNFDLRFEYYPKPGEILVVSGFHKIFTDPIEQILIAASGFEPIRSYENAERALNYGIEFEVKKGMDSFSPFLAPLSFVGNLSLIQSRIDLKGKNAFQEDKRPLQGQADYIANAGLYFESKGGRISSSLIFNRVGERISRVGFANLGDIIELPRNQIDWTFSAKLIDHLSMKLTAKDLLNQDHEFIQRTLEGDKRAELRTIGRTVALGLSYQL